jgi:membrane protein DedA with SNARE-associated domain
MTGQIIDWVGRHGAYAVFVIMALDALLPVGGELTMLYAGALAAGAIAGQQPILLGHALSTGLESYLVLALAGTLGYLAGALIGWAIGRWGGRSLVKRRDLGRAEAWFDRHGHAAVFLGGSSAVVALVAIVLVHRRRRAPA